MTHYHLIAKPQTYQTSQCDCQSDVLFPYLSVLIILFDIQSTGRLFYHYISIYNSLALTEAPPEAVLIKRQPGDSPRTTQP